MESKMIGSKIAAARKKLSLSQSQLAQQVFVSPQAVGKWERGESIPDIITLNRLAQILGVDLNYFSDGIEVMVSETSSVQPETKTVESPAAANQKKQPKWDMSKGNWVDADFSGLRNLHEKFAFSNMQNCKFVGSEMKGLLLEGNNLQACDFSGSDFSNSHIQKSNLDKNLFKQCSLKETTFSGSFIHACDFTGADLTGVVIRKGGFEKNAITNAVLNGISFIDTQLADIIFEGTLEDGVFENCAFTKVTFQNTTLMNTFFKNNSKLNRIKFVDCKADRLTYQFLKSGKADLGGITIIN